MKECCVVSPFLFECPPPRILFTSSRNQKPRGTDVVSEISACFLKLDLTGILSLSLTAGDALQMPH